MSCEHFDHGSADFQLYFKVLLSLMKHTIIQVDIYSRKHTIQFTIIEDITQLNLLSTEDSTQFNLLLQKISQNSIFYILKIGYNSMYFYWRCHKTQFSILKQKIEFAIYSTKHTIQFNIIEDTTQLNLLSAEDSTQVITTAKHSTHFAIYWR